uniref:Uncharacterized protein n=1 Tax=Tanacetum cinerariifolium TaxID=118510 RepID=A0A6L2JLC1_TANCI|nr:hypothetical protein [Tanacetum cinerariifolium]
MFQTNKQSSKRPTASGLEIGTSKPKEPKKDLENEFKDLHLNLLVLEVLTHAPMYNEILDKHMESLELGKNGSAFIQGKMPKKMKDLGLFTLPELIDNRIDWNKPTKGGDEAWHAKIRLIDPDEEEFTKTFQSIPTTRKLFEKENPSEIIDLDHFHDS